MWNLLHHVVNRKRTRPDSDEDREERPAKRRASASVLFPQPANQRTMQRRFPATPERNGLEKMRDRNNASRRRDWLADFVPPDALCYCYSKGITRCNCKQITEGTSTLQGIPSEILHEIFDRVVPPENLLNPSLHCGPNSAWCNAMVTKRALVLVSRDWYQAGIDFVYRHIVIRRLSQLPELLETLTALPGLGALVRSITFMCYVPCAFHDSTYATMERILQLCPGVTGVHDLLPFFVPIRYPFPALPKTITSIKIGPHDHAVDILDMLRLSCGQLLELALPAADDPLFDEENIIFPHLHTLCLTIGSGFGDMQTFASKWKLPQLKSLTFRLSADLDPGHSLATDYRHILKLHGRRLKYLAFPGLYPRYARPHPLDDPEDFGHLVALCPAVEQLVLPAHATCFDTYTHPSVKWLDIWCPSIHEEPAPSEHAASPRFPNVEIRRLLDPALVPHIEDLPRTIDPRASGSWTLSFPGLAVEQQEGTAVGVTVRRLVLGDLRATDDWDLTYFGTMEVHVVEREQDYFELGNGTVYHDQQRTTFSREQVEEFRRADRQRHGEVLEVDRSVPRWDSDVLQFLPKTLCDIWLADETDDEESDLESEDLAALDNEFDPMDLDSASASHSVPPPILSRTSFPWLSLAFRDSIFPPSS
ncbi:hypothetical protein B0H11DRAFT_322963 [Mycena galericulata]|nr:hypothetical protein B0H11DRAFT_322963 [Mycena galericulata]